MISSNNTAISQGRAFRQLLMTQVRQASADISIYTETLEFDAFGQALLSELEYACQRGVLVRCLIDSAGSQRFISTHPALLASLEMQFRTTDEPFPGGNVVLFDRRFAVTGSHKLRESDPDDNELSRFVADATIASIADHFEARWAAAPTWPGRPPQL